MESQRIAVEVTEDFIRYSDGTIQTPPVGHKYDVDVIRQIMDSGEAFETTKKKCEQK